MTPPSDVVVAGGGWAGLAAAVALARRGLAPTLFEAAPVLGGRARSVTLAEGIRDNGQHLLLGSCHAALGLLREVGVDPDAAFTRIPLRLHLTGPDEHIDLRLPPLPAPLHLAAAIATARGLGRRERLAALRMLGPLRRPLPGPDHDRPVAELLAAHGQPARLVELLWAPLCLAALNTPVERASSRLFLRVLREAFARRRDADLLINRRPLGACLPEPARRYIEARGGRVITGCPVTGLRIERGSIVGVRTEDADVPARHLVLATPSGVTARLLRAEPALAGTAAALDGLEPAPIATVYLRYPRPVALAAPMVGHLGTLVQWLFDRGDLAPGLVAAVISGAGPHTAWRADALAERATAELAALHPEWPAPAACRVVRQRRATFDARPGIDRLRPIPETAVTGCWLAGDYTATGLPATLEGAVRSGVQCAARIAESLSSA